MARWKERIREKMMGAGGLKGGHVGAGASSSNGARHSSLGIEGARLSGTLGWPDERDGDAINGGD